MANKLYLSELKTICQALGDFAEARSKPQPDRDLILTVKKINGRETLETLRVSEMSWLARLVRWFGFGGATLTSVASYLQSHEPYLPSKFASLRYQIVISLCYKKSDVDDVMKLDKTTYRKLREQKSKGCEIFKRCLVHHNAASRYQVYILLQEHEKTDLKNHGSSSFAGVTDHWPNPMGPLNKDDERFLHERYHHPIIDVAELGYLDPFFRRGADSVLPHVLGFCYEYGLGVKRQRDEAYKYYEKGVAANQYSSCYNLGRMLVEDGRERQAIDVLEKGEDSLIVKIDEAQQSIDDAKARLDPDLQKIEDHHSRLIKAWQKALRKTCFVLLKAYENLGDQKKVDEYSQKI